MAHKIGMISLYLPSGSKIGAGYQAHAMANAFVERGWEVTMHSPCDRPEDALYEHVMIPVGDRLRTFRFAWELGRRDWSRFDVVHAHGDDYFIWGQKPVHVRTMHGSCMTEALHIPGIKEKLRMALLGLSEIVATAAAHRTVGVSENTRRSYPWIRQVIPNGVNLERFHPANAKEMVPTILFVGTYKNRKRGELLMKAFVERVRPALPKAQLWMVCGDAPEAPGVTVLGRVSEEKLADLYRRAWVFCLPSSYEGFGVPYIEAMASGTAVVATPNPGSVEVLAHGRFGRLVAAEALGDAVLELLQNRGERERLVAAGLERAQQYQWPRILDQYRDLYRKLGCCVEEIPSLAVGSMPAAESLREDAAC
ncbi:MAG TPA: glycosyltransferase family 4 protein [Chthoniobacter sp.]|nr:glycosyltransferase family 4 protein [Chthoniobacter sp.]